MKINKIIFKLFLTILLFSSILNYNFSENINVENISYDDSYSYNYFNNILLQYIIVLKDMNTYKLSSFSYLNNSLNIYSNLQNTKKEINYYKSKNITVTATYIINPFYNLSKNINELCNLNYDLETKYNVKEDSNNIITIQKAKITSYQINNTISKIYDNLNEIDKINILKKGNSTLYFNTNDIRKELNRYLKKYNIENNEINEKFNKIKNKINENNSLIVEVSNNNPYLNENITIIIYDLTNKSIPVNVHIGGKIYKKYLKNEINYMPYNFNTEGYYEIYATKKINNKTIISNTIFVKSLKIPTKIVAKSNYTKYINEPINITGIVVDNNNNKITNGKIIVYFNNNSNNPKIYKLNNGEFNIFLKENSSKIVKLNIIYPGNNIYEKSDKNITVEFSKYPIYIILNNINKEIYSGELYNLTGHIYTSHNSLNTQNKTYPINIYLNNTLYKTINVTNNFSTNISFDKSGNYIIYATYNGSNIYKNSKSNILNINVNSKESYLISYISILLIIIIIILFYFAKIRILKTRDDYNGDEGEIIVENLEKKHKEKEDNIIEDISKLEIDEAYKLLFNKLVKEYNLEKNITPRTLLNNIKEKRLDIITDLEYITDVHEKAIYGKQNIKTPIKYIFFEKIEKIIGEINEY